MAAPSGVRGASAGWCAGWVARRSYRSRRGYAHERCSPMRPGRRHAPHATAASATHRSRACCEPAAPATRQDAHPSPDAAQPSNTHSPATPQSASTPGHDHPAASGTRPTRGPHTTTPQRHTQTRPAASSRACGQHRSHTPAAWSEPDEPYTTTAKTAKTSPISLPTKIPGAGNNTSHLRPKGQTTLTHTANWHPLGQQFSAPRPTTDRLSRRPRLQLDDPSRAPRSYDACVISPRRGRVAPSCPATGNPRPDSPRFT